MNLGLTVCSLLSQAWNLCMSHARTWVTQGRAGPREYSWCRCALTIDVRGMGIQLTPEPAEGWPRPW